MGRPWPVLIVVLLVAAGCAKATRPSGSPRPGPSSSASSPKTVPALKLDVLDAAGGHLAYCDPDQFPVARGDALENARARFPMIRGDRPTFEAILVRERLSPTQAFTPDQII